MEASILTATKKVLGIDSEYIEFDLDITMHINSAFSSLNSLGIGPVDGFVIEDADAVWDDLGLPLVQLSMVKTYVFLKTRMLFDPPTTSYLIDATERQIAEHAWRLTQFREGLQPLPVVEPPRPVPVLEGEPTW